MKIRDIPLKPNFSHVNLVSDNRFNLYVATAENAKTMVFFEVWKNKNKKIFLRII